MITQKPANNNLTLIIFSVIFFGWGLLTSLNGVLVGHLNNIFELDSFRSGLINFTFFATYFFISLVFFIISGKKDILNNLGYKYLTVLGLAIAAIGAYLFYPASALLSFPFFLFALIVLASGITILQISANTYITTLVNDDLGSSRLTLAQALNSVGATLGPAIGAALITKSLEVTSTDMAILHPNEILAFKEIEGASVQLPYWLIATSLFVLAALIFFLPMPDINSRRNDERNPEADAQRNLMMATIGIFVYVGAEVTIGANLGNIIDNLYPNLSGEKTFLITSYWALAMVGRFVGGSLLRLINCGTMLFFFAAGAVLLLIPGMMASGSWTIYLLVGIGGFNSIMFPGIFSSGLRKLNDYTGKGASLLIMAIAGGALIPALYNVLTPMAGLKGALIIAAICYAYIAFYGKYYQNFSESKK